MKRVIIANTQNAYTLVYISDNPYGSYGSQALYRKEYTAPNDEEAVRKAFREWRGWDEEDFEYNIPEGGGMLDISGKMDVEFSADSSTIVAILQGSRIVFTTVPEEDAVYIMKHAPYIEDIEENPDEDWDW